MRDGPPLTPAQQRALAHVAAQCAGPPLGAQERVTLQFHPDRLAGGRPILAAMADDGRYRSQFETGTSNGGLTAHPGGDRWAWESRLFGSAYDDAPPDQRPVYGALNHRRRAVGGAQRFGSAHLRLTADVNARTTFCYPDSVLEPVDFGVAERMPLIEIAEADSVDLLDDCIEAHVHGPVRIPDDVEALVLDPCFRGTTVETGAARLGCVVEWHPGFRITADVLAAHPEYRGRRFVDLGLRLAVDGVLDATMIGTAAHGGHYDEQDLKRVWHLLARFGSP
ncbi:DUF3626 domain-containing protein [Ruania sp. N2-46]|uniref:DUF3626 domain-containing protein n=1 Tax=Occultella gossypii TaxID=2800820 RepID=A0ABS7S6P3_9MICO|nr:DUF3626 domain-containing protein [Occultella gossypii]